MKVIALVGSLRENSIHRSLYETYKGLTQDIFELEEGVIENIPMYKGIDDEPLVIELGKKISSADAVLFFSPEYNYSVSGVLKNTIDCLSRLKPQPFAGKPAAIIGASPGAVGSARMQYHLRQIGVFLDIQFLNRPEVMISNVLAKFENGKLVDEKTLDFLVVQAKSLKEFAMK